MRIKWILLAAFIACLGAPALGQKTDEADLLKTTDAMIAATARLRGLAPKAPILRGVKNRKEISQYLDERVQSDFDPNELRLEGRVLQKLGLIPPELDYKEFLLKLLAEQVAGFYDPEKKTFFIASWLSVDEQQPTMVHELTHALQDQYFDLSKLIKKDHDLNDDDRTLAHEAFWEGDATAVMMDYLLQKAKRHFADLPDLAAVMRLQTLLMQEQIPVFKSAPSFIQETLIFPYGYGSSFMQQIWKQNPSWETVNKIYSDLPASTEQIMHPEKYYGHRDEPKPVHAEALAAKLGQGWKIVYKNVLGEFSLGLLLNLHLTDEHARKAATGWGGDQMLLLQNGSGKDAVLISTLWDSTDDATKFFSAMDEWFRLHCPEAERTKISPTEFSIAANGEYYSLQSEGAAVHFFIGLPEADGRKLDKQNKESRTQNPK